MTTTQPPPAPRRPAAPKRPARGRASRESRHVGHTLLPGTAGTKRLQAEYGDRLLYVRYRYDADRAVRTTTVELIVDERPWIPSVPPGTVVGIRVGWDQLSLHQRLRAEGARWDPRRKLWLVEWRAVKKLRLRKHVDPATFPPAVQARLPRSVRASLGPDVAGGDPMSPKGETVASEGPCRIGQREPKGGR